jgi:hypothetical protein
MTGPPERFARPRPQAATADRCLLVGDGRAGPGLLRLLGQQRMAAARRGTGYEVHVVVPYGQPLVACLALGDPLSGWVITDEAASRAWHDAGRETAERRLAQMLWLLWEMEVPATGETVDRTELAERLQVMRHGYDGVIMLRSAGLVGRWRQWGWARRLQRLAAPVARVDDRR